MSRVLPQAENFSQPLIQSSSEIGIRATGQAGDDEHDFATSSMIPESTSLERTSNLQGKSQSWLRLKAFLFTFLTTSVLLLGYRPSMSSISTEVTSVITIYEEYNIESTPARTTSNSYRWSLTEIFPSDLNKSMLVVNGVSPGPLIEARQNEFVFIEVVNGLSSGVTIHWHGISQFNSNDQDGTPSLVQSEILPGESFEYRFQVQNSGTYWWHAHSGGKRLDGLTGPLIVHPMDSVNDIAYLKFDHHNLTDVAILVGDWYEHSADTYAPNYLSGSNTDLMEPRPTAIRINGQVSDLHKHSLPLTLLAKDRTTRYMRLRFINVGAIAPVVVKLLSTNRTMLIVEADATLVSPVEIQDFSMAVGQRYSVVIDFQDYADDEDVDLKIELDMSSHAHHKHLSKHVLGRLDQLTSIVENQVMPKVLHDGLLHSASAARPAAGRSGARGTADLPFFTLTLGTMRQNGFTRSTINNVSYVPSNTPLIEQFGAKSREDDATRLSFKYSPDILTLSVAQGEEVLLLLQNVGSGPHPFHVHGHVMEILATETFFYDPLVPNVRPPRAFDPASIPSLLAGADEHGRGTLGRVSLSRDTVDIAGHGWALVRIEGGGRGLWLAHCHITWHELSGMRMVLEVR